MQEIGFIQLKDYVNQLTISLQIQMSFHVPSKMWMEAWAAGADDGEQT